jgi:hypothetical protein
MPIEHPIPTEATVKYLYAHAYRCAYGDCRRPLYRVDEQTGARILNSRVCHINARREGGPRWDPNQTTEENRFEQNLVLMCTEHASTIDEPASLSVYPADRLREWKSKQLREYEQLQQGWTLDTDMAREAIRVSFSLAELVISNSNVKLAGEGGNAPGAGGGGGGAFGRGARGGRGGQGGGHRIDDGEYRLPLDQSESACELTEELGPQAGPTPNFNPGAGGGGAGAIGDGAIGGDGGGGGERVSALIDLVPLRSAGLDHIEVVVGEGGQGSGLPGQHGGRGQDTVLKFVAKDGTILKTVRAAGGFAGRSGSSHLPDDAVGLSHEDIRNGFRITTLMPVSAAEFREGVLYILGGGWTRFTVPIPTDAVWPIVCTARWNTLGGVKRRGIFLSLMHPAGHEVSCQTLIVPAIPAQHGCIHWVYPIGATFDVEGTWLLRVHSGGFTLAEFEIQVQPK